jgi:hypothetical protein
MDAVLLCSGDGPPDDRCRTIRSLGVLADDLLQGDRAVS